MKAPCRFVHNPAADLVKALIPHAKGLEETFISGALLPLTHRRSHLIYWSVMHSGGRKEEVAGAYIAGATSDTEQQLLAAALEQLSTATLILADSGTISYANPAACTLTRIARERLVGTTFDELLAGLTGSGAGRRPRGTPRPQQNGTRSGVLFVRSSSGTPRSITYRIKPLEMAGSEACSLVELAESTSRNETIEQLRRSSERFRSVAMSDASIVWVGDEKARVVESPEWEAYTGTDECRALGDRWFDFVHEEDRTRLESLWKEAAAQAKPASFEYRLLHKDGEYRHVREHIAPVLAEDGSVREWVGAVTDLHERRQSEEMRARLAAIVASSDDAIISKDLNGYITSWNEGATRIFGYTAQEAIGKHITLVIPEERHAEEAHILSRLRQGERIDHFETVRRRKDGELRHLSLTISPLVDSRGRIVGASKIGRDITEQKRTQEQIEQQTRTLESLLKVASSLSANLDTERLIQVVTDAGTEMSGAQFGAFFHNVSDEGQGSYSLYTLSGVRKEEFAGLPMPRPTGVLDPTFSGADVIRSDDVTADPRYGKRPPYYGMPEGHPPVRSYLAVPVRSHSGEVIGGLFFGHEEPGKFSEQAQNTVRALASHAATALDNARLYEHALSLNATLEEKVRQRTAELRTLNQELESFNYSVSHDLRAPLRGIDGFSQLLLEDYGDSLDSHGREYLQRIRRGTQRMSRLIEDLLQLSYLTRTNLKIESVNLSDLVVELSDDLAKSDPQRRLELTVQPGMVALGDPSLLQIVLENLLGNAWKFTASRPVTQIEVGAHDGDKETTFYVRDNGAGFAMEYADRLFTPFQRLHGQEEYEGSGIGLATVQRIVRRHGGRIWAQGEPQQGATFSFTLPKRLMVVAQQARNGRD